QGRHHAQAAPPARAAPAPASRCPPSCAPAAHQPVRDPAAAASCPPPRPDPVPNPSACRPDRTSPAVAACRRTVAPAASWTSQRQLGTHLLDHRFVVRLIENSRTGDEGIGARRRDLTDILRIDAAVDLQTNLATAGIDQRTRFTQL